MPDINLNEYFKGSGTVGTGYGEADAGELRALGAVFPWQIRIDCFGIVQPMLEDGMGVVHTTARDFLLQFVNLSDGLHGLLQIVLRVGGIAELVGEVFICFHVNEMFVGAKAEETFEVVDVDGDGLSEHIGIIGGNRDLPEPREDGVAETDETEAVAELVVVIAALTVRPRVVTWLSIVGAGQVADENLVGGKSEVAQPLDVVRQLMGLLGRVHDFVFEDDGVFPSLMDIDVDALVVPHLLFGDDCRPFDEFRQSCAAKEVACKGFEHLEIALRVVLCENARQDAAVCILVGPDGIHEVYVIRQIGLQVLLQTNDFAGEGNVVDGDIHAFGRSMFVGL